MTYKTIVVHVDDHAESAPRIRLALELAKACKARLIGLAVMPRPQMPADIGVMAGSADVLAIQETTNKERLTVARRLFEQTVRGAGVEAEYHGVVADAAGAMNDELRYADIGVVGQRDPEQTIGDMYATLPESVAMESRRPVVVVPHIGYAGPVGRKVLLAWNDSPESMRAATEAMPLLQAAEKVTLLVIDAHKRDVEIDAANGQDDPPGSRAAGWLARHGVNAEVINDVSDGLDVGSIILSRVSDLGIDLVVMGIYGHSKLRETFFGGASRTMLGHMTVPTLIAH
ncbi:MAG: universal stress protein [Reyranellaceae bacterium]